MKLSKSLLFSLTLLLAIPASPQNAAPNVAASASTAVPPLIPYSGGVNTASGAQPAASANVTFLIYKDEQSGEPLFAETQAVALDATGHYKAQLGATLTNGIPIDLFATGEARWLEVQVAGEAPQPRILLVSVPYALKAADAATLGGLPPSAFALAHPASEAASAVSSAITPNVISNVTTTGGVAGYVPEFSGASSIVDSPIFVNTTGLVGIGTTTPTATLNVNGSTTLNGQLLLPATGTATAAKGFNSQLFKIYTSAFNSSTNAVVVPRFEWQGEVTGNDTAAPGATLNLLSSTTASNAAETGFYFNANGTMNFAPGQTFPGAGTVSSVGLSAPSSDFTVNGSPVSATGTLGLNWNVAPTSAVTANSIVKRDSSGNFSGNVVGAASMLVSNGTTFLANAVGIGTTSPQALLDVEQSGTGRSDGTFRFFQPSLGSGNDNSIAWGRAPGQAGLQWFKYVSGGPSVFGWNHWGDSASLTIQQGGKVGVGTMTPTELLHVAGRTRIDGGLNFGGAGEFIGLNRNIATGAIYNPSYGAYQIGQEISSTGGDFLIEQYNAAGTGIGAPFIISTTGHVGLNSVPDTTAPVSVGGNLKFTAAGSSLIFADGTTQSTAAAPGTYALLAANNTFTGNQAITGNLGVSGTANAGVVNAATEFDLGGSLFAFGSQAKQSVYLGFAGKGNSFTTDGGTNTGSGYQALLSNTTGSGNTASGVSALYSNTGGQSNTASGAFALDFSTTGNNNTANGFAGLYSNTTGNYDTASGSGALFHSTTGSYNTASGYDSLVFNTTGSNNVGIGYDAGNTVDASAGTGSGNTAVGAASMFSTGSIANATAIGANSEVTRSNTLILGCIAGTNGCPASVSVGIGTTTPSSLLTVNGSITIAKAGSGIVFADGTTQTTSSSAAATLVTVQANYSGSTDATCSTGYYVVAASCNAGVNLVLNGQTPAPVIGSWANYLTPNSSSATGVHCDLGGAGLQSTVLLRCAK